MKCPRCGGGTFGDCYGSRMCARFCGWSYEPFSLALAVVHFGARSAARPGSRDGKPWNDDERATLLELADHFSFVEVAEVLDRSHAGVRAEWNRLNPGRRKPYQRTRTNVPDRRRMAQGGR